MVVYILLILIAWFVPMLLWLSILTTVLCGLGIIAKLIKFGVDMSKED